MFGRQKVIKIGTSRGITIPSRWLKWQEKRLGREIKYLIITGVFGDNVSDGIDEFKVFIPISYHKAIDKH